MRSSILQQLKDLKALKDDDVLTENEFSLQKDKLLKEMNSLPVNYGVGVVDSRIICGK